MSKRLCCRPLNAGEPHQPAHPESLFRLTGKVLSVQRLEEVLLLQMHRHQKATRKIKKQGNLTQPKELN